MNTSQKRVLERKARAVRVRKKISGTTQRPRLCVRRSLNHIYAQIVDDVSGKTLVLVGTTGEDFRSKVSGQKLTKVEESKVVGQIVAEKAKGKGITTVVFDRKGYLFHGRVKALAEAVRNGGLSF
ncbi:MAG: 50S ribosomal protein L18 [Chitinispirillaceae bacterium]|nr:50S ribosomal protein L18 [Chitinispirillaceae bacterium]